MRDCYNLFVLHTFSLNSFLSLCPSERCYWKFFAMAQTCRQSRFVLRENLTDCRWANSHWYSTPLSIHGISRIPSNSQYIFFCLRQWKRSSCAASGSRGNYRSTFAWHRPFQLKWTERCSFLHKAYNWFWGDQRIHHYEGAVERETGIRM